MQHREVTLTMAQVQRYETIRAAPEGRLTGEEAAKAIDPSRRRARNSLAAEGFMPSIIMVACRPRAPTRVLRAGPSDAPRRPFPR